MTLRSRIAVAAALLVGAAVTPVVLSAPAQAAACTGSGGVSVLVDFAELGGGVTAGCADVADGTRAGATLTAAGYGLTMATKSPGFLCRVNGVPSSDPCAVAAPADAYWSVWWADGDGGNWVYSARGIESLRVPDGGYLALSWHQGKDRAQPPAAVPVSRAPAPPKASRTPRPTQAPGGNGSGSKGTSEKKSDDAPGASLGTTASGRPSANTSASTGPSASATPSAGSSDAPSDTPSPGESVSVDPDLPAADEISAGPESVAVETTASQESLPVWVPLVVVSALVVLGGSLALVRRRRV